MDFSKHNAGTTSVKVHHGPGGASSIQLGGGYGEDKPAVEKPSMASAVPQQ